VAFLLAKIMTPAQFAEYVRLKTRTNSTTFTDADIIIFMRQRQDEIAQAILKADEDILLVPQTDSLVANQRDYSFPTDILSRIKRVEAKLDGTNWIKLNEIDITQHKYPTDETNITYYFSNLEGEAFYDILRNQLYIYSGTITNVSNGLKLWCNTWPTAITDLTSTTEMNIDPSTTTHGIPRPLHEIWARGVIIDYKQSRERPIPLGEGELKYEVDLQKAIETIKHGNLDREVIASVPYNDGSQY
jgi:hypothetical protein